MPLMDRERTSMTQVSIIVIAMAKLSLRSASHGLAVKPVQEIFHSSHHNHSAKLNKFQLDMRVFLHSGSLSVKVCHGCHWLVRHEAGEQVDANIL